MHTIIQNPTQYTVIEAEDVGPQWMDGLLSLPMRMQQGLDVIGCETVNGECIRHGPRIELIPLPEMGSCHQRVVHLEKLVEHGARIFKKNKKIEEEIAVNKW